jgi:uncharacterized protein with gpF-like domain
MKTFMKLSDVATEMIALSDSPDALKDFNDALRGFPTQKLPPQRTQEVKYKLTHEDEENIKKAHDDLAKRVSRVRELMTKSFDDLMLSGESEELQNLYPEAWKEKVKGLKENP